MQVLIVAKTHLSGALCVGGLSRDTNQNVRLMQPGDANQPVDTAYEIGDVWELDFSPRKGITPPHIEDVIVQRAYRLGHVANLKSTLLKRVSVWRGEPDRLFDTFLQFSPNGSGYIASESGLPGSSVGFWIANGPLLREERFGKTQYRTPDYGFKITYVGVADSITAIPAGTLMRVSLARWWRPFDADVEARCYLQLSGWYL